VVNLLVVEDDENSRKLIAAVLKRAGYQAHVTASAADALVLLEHQMIDLIILDIMMPGMDGYELTHMLRESGSQLPILMVTAKQLPVDKKKGFLAGTDDYMTKPVDTEEMLLRIRALLRRAQIAAERRLVMGEVVLNSDTFTVTRKDEREELPQKEFQLLYKLLSYPGHIFTRLQLMDDIWGIDSNSSETTVNTHMNRLRRRFEHYPEFELVSVRGVGYKAVTHL
jgi:two-component system, OmpR family, response regulator